MAVSTTPSFSIPGLITTRGTNNTIHQMKSTLKLMTLKGMKKGTSSASETLQLQRIRILHLVNMSGKGKGLRKEECGATQKKT